MLKSIFIHHFWMKQKNGKKTVDSFEKKFFFLIQIFTKVLRKCLNKSSKRKEIYAMTSYWLAVTYCSDALLMNSKKLIFFLKKTLQ